MVLSSFSYINEWEKATEMTEGLTERSTSISILGIASARVAVGDD